ncbi:polysaccharide deacetylase family protein [Solimicrobium silvestre]|uniref:Polysaccharide deacetylase n=1 Tax=Solimicrobium silvestre TaxID=2099400 RepID=A0A2S9H5H2_9BURK|nr:polysaccharide deacetylase family protein [Solimicrobium silvestre]PRC95217.1 Polysaccharide deacetylase [Solimicrobium silvestre]
MFALISTSTTKKWLAGLVCGAYLTLLCTAPHAQNSQPPASMSTDVQTLINNYRRILALQELSISANAATPKHQEAVRIGEYLFIENQHLSTSITERLLVHPQHGTQTDIDDFLTALNNPALQDADLFAVRSIVTEVAKKGQLSSAQGKQIRAVLKNLAIAHNKYGQELSVVLSQKTITQSKPERPAWAAYIAEIEKEYPPNTVLEELGHAIPNQEQQATPSDKTAELVAQTRANEWQGLQLEKGTVLLTFDDGPHPVYTKEILEILARYKVKAIFFQLGQNLGTVTDGHAELTRNEEVEKEILNAGHAIANHSFTHPFLPKLDQAQVQQEIDKTQALLDLIIPEDAHRTHMFRAPYGARNSMILGEIGERGLRSVLWNVDSLDWSDPVPESIVHRILQELEHAGRGIILMHDIHPKTVIALPMLLDELIKRGYHFVQWDGEKLVATVRENPATSAPVANPATAIPMSSESNNSGKNQ